MEHGKCMQDQYLSLFLYHFGDFAKVCGLRNRIERSVGLDTVFPYAEERQCLSAISDCNGQVGLPIIDVWTQECGEDVSTGSFEKEFAVFLNERPLFLTVETCIA